MIEEWKIIEEFSDYQISNFGRVKSFKVHNGSNERILKLKKTSKGYFAAMLYIKDKKRKTYLVHRLVLEAFKPEHSFEKNMCNHIDGNKQNNYVNNLEWCTHTENIRHAVKIGLIVGRKGKDNPLYGTHPTEETRKKLSKASKGRYKGENHPMYGKHHTEESKKKISEKVKGENHPLYGKHHSEKTKKILSNIMSGENHPRFGTKHTIETIRKMSECKMGENNCVSKLTDKEIFQIKEYLNEGVLSQSKIAKIFNVTQTTISCIKLGKTWKHI